MGKLHVTYAGHLSDRVEDLYYETVKPEGIDLHFIPVRPEEAFHRMVEKGEFEASEMSLSTYIASVARGEAPFVAIPVFPSRMFRHGAIYVNTDAGIREPRDLIGRKVGVPEYQMTAALWVRGFLLHDYGVRPEEVVWYTGGLHDAGREQMIATEIPGVAIQHVPDRSLNDLLLSGEIDALISARTPNALQQRHPKVRRLFTDYAEAERDYYRRTRLFPIMHTVVLRRAFYEQYPWAAVSLYQAFLAAKNNAVRRLDAGEMVALPIALPWIVSEAEKTLDLMGKDLWPYGLEANLGEIEAMCQYSFEQGISPRRVTPRELFADNVVDLAAVTRI